MYILFIVIIFILSAFSFSKNIGDFLVEKKRYISIFFYMLIFLSFFYLFSDDHHAIKETWEKSLDLLWFILWLPILANVFELYIAQKLMPYRKEIWLLMWILAIIHTLQYFLWDHITWFWEQWFWFYNWNINYLVFWFIATIITLILTITSNKFSMIILWTKWKIVHKTIYILLIFTLLHVAFMKINRWWFSVILIEFIPFIIYFFFKILEWKNKKILFLKSS